MKRNRFGRLGWQVTEVGFGAWAIGGVRYGQVDERDALAALSTYMEEGGNFIDTARGYNRSESILGRFLQAERARDEVYLCSKIGRTDAEGIRRDAEESLRQLQVEVIDLMYIHNPPDDRHEMQRVLDVYSELKEQGKIRAIGASIKGPNVTRATQDLCIQYIETGRIDAIQIIVSILRQANRDIFHPAQEAGVALVGRTCLESGFLTAKYAPGHTFPENDHRNRWDDAKRDSIFRIARELQDSYAKPPYESLADVALRFCLDQEGLATIIPGAKNAEQVRANVAVASLPPLPEIVHRELRARFEGRDDMANT